MHQIWELIKYQQYFEPQNQDHILESVGQQNPLSRPESFVFINSVVKPVFIWVAREPVGRVLMLLDLKRLLLPNLADLEVKEELCSKSKLLIIN